MLTTHLNTVPYSKFVLIEDTVHVKAQNLLDYLLKLRSINHQCYYLIFQKDFKRTKQQYSNVNCYDFTSDYGNWLDSNLNIDQIVSDLDQIDCIVFFDSLIHVIYKYGLGKTYQILQQLKNSNHIRQIVAVLHTDLVLLEDRDCIQRYFEHLSTFLIELQIKFDDFIINKKQRLSYTFKKSNRKIIKDIEEFWFENGRLLVEKIKKPETIKLIDNNLNNNNNNDKLPENLSTFKISLSDKDKESRNNLILPYLPKDNGETSGGRIDYTFDDFDDWDEEDPDDDLDI